MKYITFIFVFFAVFTVNCHTESNNEPNINPLFLNNLFSFEYNRPKNPNQEELMIIRYILKHTYENNIHKMRGEIDNVVYVHEDGREAVFDKDGNLVTNSYNRGSFNYYSNKTEPIKKFIFDIAPWLKWGNTEDDPTSFNERLHYYTLDLNYGIQTYIFYGADEELEIVDFNKLTMNEKEVYYIFMHIIFNENYKIKLNNDNMQKLRDDGEYYFEYFYQIQNILNVRNSGKYGAN